MQSTHVNGLTHVDGLLCLREGLAGSNQSPAQLPREHTKLVPSCCPQSGGSAIARRCESGAKCGGFFCAEGGRGGAAWWLHGGAHPIIIR